MGGGSLLRHYFFSQTQFVHKENWGEKKRKDLIHFSLGKAGPFTLEKHMHFKSSKCKVHLIIYSVPYETLF
jgi:hypothetical protein